MSVEIHFWDMDHTIVDNDCDVSWKRFVVDQGLAEEAETLAQADHFFEQYCQAALDIDAFMAFQLREFRGQSQERMRALAREHFEAYVRHRIYPEAVEKIEAFREAGVLQCLLTATNRVIAEPVAEHLGLTHVLATELASDGDCFTGEYVPPYCGGKGKLHHLDGFCRAHGGSRDSAWYYGDSGSDIPVLSAVGHPVAINPEGALLEAVVHHDWPVLRFARLDAE